MIPLIKEFKKSTPLVEILCGTSIAVYLTTGKNPVNWEGKVWLPDPAVKIDLPKQTGTLKQDPCEISIARANSQHPGIATLVSLLSKPFAIPTMTVRVINLIESSPDDFLPVYLFEGVVDRSFRNAQKQQGTLKFSFLPEHLLGMAEATLGRRADASCDHTYGGVGCFVDVTRFFDAGTYWTADGTGFPAASPHYGAVRKAHVTAVMFATHSKRQLTATLDGAFHPGANQKTLTNQPKGWWVRGFFEKDGLRIGIADWKYNDTINRGTNIFILNKIPPVSWDTNAPMVLHPGCQRTPQACSDRQNSNNFGGLGFGIPAYNPTMEVDAR